MAEERHQIILEARGEVEVERLNKKVKEQEAVLKQLIATQASAASQGRDFSQAINDSAGRLENLGRSLDQARSRLDAFRSSQVQLTEVQKLAAADAAAIDEITTRGPRGPNQPFGGRQGFLPPPIPNPIPQGADGDASKLTYSISTLAFSLDDAQQFAYGFQQGMRAISNNIPQLVSSFSNLREAGIAGTISALAGPAGLTIAITALGFAATQLINHWGDIQSALGLGFPQPALQGPEKLADQLKKATDEMEKLRKESRLTLEDVLKLRELERTLPQLRQQQKDIQETERLVETPPKETQERGAGVKAAIEQVGGEKAVEELAAALEKTADAAGKVANPFGGTRGTPEEIARVLLLEASRGDEFARGQITRTVGNRTGLGAAIFNESPETKLQEEITAEDQKESDRRLAEHKQHRKELREKETENLKDLDEKENKAALELVALGERLTEQGARPGETEEDIKARKKEEDEAKKTAQEQVRGASASGADLIAKSAAQGGVGAGDVEQFLRRRYGLNAEAASQIALKGSQAASEELIKGGLEGGSRRTSEITSDIASDIQRGVSGGDKMDTSIRIQEQIRDEIKASRQDVKRDYAGRPIVSGKYF